MWVRSWNALWAVGWEWCCCFVGWRERGLFLLFPLVPFFSFPFHSPPPSFPPHQTPTNTSTGDPTLIHPFLAEIGKDRRKSNENEATIRAHHPGTSISSTPELQHSHLVGLGIADENGNTTPGVDTGAAALHLAIRCGSVHTISLLLAHRAISPNGIHPPGSGTTALHLAASLGRTDVVTLLLEQDGINDTLRDAQGRTARDLAKSKEVVRLIDDSRALLNATYRSLLHSYLLSPPTAPPPPVLLDLLASPRVKYVDLKYLDESGTSLLHEAARRRDLRLIELGVRAGADVFVRDRRGKMAHEVVPKGEEKVRVFLRQSDKRIVANQDQTLIMPPSPLTEPPSMKGYLNKYTNVAKGYNSRWFVLKAGVLSYYRHAEDEKIASRGSVSMKTAIVKQKPGDRLRFEVHSMPGRGHHSPPQKWYLKANHPVEASRWALALQRSVEWYRGGGIERRSGESEEGAVASVPSTRHSYSPAALLRRSTTRALDIESLGGMGTGTGPSPTDGGGSVASASGVPAVHVEPVDASPSMNDPEEERDDLGPLNGERSPDGGESPDEDGERSSSASESDARRRVPPYEDSFELHGNAIAAQLELTLQLLSNLPLPLEPRERETQGAIACSLGSVQGMINEYVGMVSQREGYFKKEVQRERERQKVWEESLASVVREGEALEKELRLRSRKRGSRVFMGSTSGGSGSVSVSTRRRSLRSPPVGRVYVREEGVGEMGEAGEYSSFAVPVNGSFRRNPGRSQTMPPVRSPSPVPSRPRGPVAGPAPPSYAASTSGYSIGDAQDEEEEEFSTDEEDEFFDAIDSNNLPNLTIPESIVSPTRSETAPSNIPDGMNVNMDAYKAYTHLRKRLGVRADNRPSTSLWSVLKHSIGKDLTKISFPVFFNEPTSMLQRMAEDMEFSECLDVAATERDPLRRIAFVAAFAMSNYSSTIGRIAKPFNPMLSETFEYVRIDKKYRYVSEQVSHHPPISACWAESPLWHYYGEVDAQNKFMGKSFEIRPTGVAHAELVLPEEWGPGYPKSPRVPGKVIEHYSWKKVTTNVSGFIIGSPTIDHYGDMVIKNHRTGDQCILTFKPRGWRGKDAYEIAGDVMDANGRIAYQIAGRWNSQLVASQYMGGGRLNPDVSIDGTASPSAQEHIMLWRNSDKPPGLRPDQRAFELGHYELANDLKHDQEEKQRSIRRARELGEMPPHKPRWFTSDTDGDTQERVWTPRVVGKHQLEYWVERERVWREGGGDASWKNVEDIFIEEPDAIKSETTNGYVWIIILRCKRSTARGKDFTHVIAISLFAGVEDDSTCQYSVNYSLNPENRISELFYIKFKIANIRIIVK
ncbi:Oxysterol-binding protein-domain-containing protein [Cyathus striatus]|nr:Oxysterol-binding protein-domain-containing protein [Cyathus striatus]